MKSQFYGLERESGIYLIRNDQNGCRYIGSALKFRGRFTDHLWRLKLGIHFNWKLQQDFNQWGEDAFSFEVLAVVRDPKERIQAEEFVIGKFFGEECYNLTIACPPYRVGFKRSAEFCKKQSERLKGRRLSEETKKKIRSSLLGSKSSEECKKKQSMFRLGRKESPEIKARRKEKHFWKSFSQEERERRSKENGARLRAINLGSKASDETKAKMRDSKLGNQNHPVGIKTGPQSPEWIAKRVASRKATIEAKKSLLAKGSV